MESIFEFARARGFDIGGFAFDSEFHRFATDPKRPNKKDGWAIGRTHTTHNGRTLHFANLGSWRTQECHEFKDNVRLTRAERRRFNEAQTEIRKKQDQERAKMQAKACVEAEQLVSKCEPITTKYLEKKGVGLHNVGSIEENGERVLIVPTRNIGGVLSGVQRIYPNSEKMFLWGQKKSGCFHVLGELSEATEKIYLGEGYATVASVFEAMRVPAVVAFDSGNLPTVAAALKDKFPKLKFVVVGDDDRKNKRNCGRLKATEAAKTLKGIAIFPAFPDGIAGADFNDLHLSSNLEEVNRQITAGEEAAAKRIDLAFAAIERFCESLKIDPTKKMDAAEFESLDALEEDHEPLFNKALAALKKCSFLKDYVAKARIEWKVSRAKQVVNDNEGSPESAGDVETDVDGDDTAREGDAETQADLFLDSAGHREGDRFPLFQETCRVA